MDLKGKNVVYVGGLGGIGFCTAKILMTKNLAHLVIFDIMENANALKELQAMDPNCKVLYSKFDITNEANITKSYEDAIKEIKQIDVVINGAGIIHDRNIELSVGVNVIGLMRSTLTALKYMSKTSNGHGGGMIVNIGSVVGLEPFPCFAVYSATKFALVGFSRSLADQYYYDITNVKIVLFCPGYTDTNLYENGAVGRDTFEYSRPLTMHVLNSGVGQSPEQCGEHLVKAIETSKNGDIWISDMGNLSPVTLHKYWQPTLKN